MFEFMSFSRSLYNQIIQALIVNNSNNNKNDNNKGLNLKFRNLNSFKAN